MNPLTKKRAETTRLLRLAVAQGHADAHVVLADLLSEGHHRIMFIGVNDIVFNGDADDDEAIRLLQLALVQGSAQRHLEGMHSIAQLYVPHALAKKIFVTFCRYRRRGDHAEAFKHFKLAHDAGSIQARAALAEMYRLGQGVAQDVTEALKLFMLDAEDSCENGSYISHSEHSSLHQIRDIYLDNGDGVEAIKWCVISISLSLYFGDKATGASAALTEGTCTSCSTWRACMRCCVDAELRFTNSRPFHVRGVGPKI
jgi:TPR repeat protein